MNKQKYRIVDLDNCVADDGWRIKNIAWGRKEPNAKYATYHSLCGFDEAHNADLFWRAGEQAIIFTGRPCAVRAITVEWLRRHNMPYVHLIMRNNDDHSPSVALKSKMLSWLWSTYGIELEQIANAFDDHQPIVDMYKSFGIPAHQLKIHSLDAYTNPFTQEKL